MIHDREEEEEEEEEEEDEDEDEDDMDEEEEFSNKSKKEAFGVINGKRYCKIGCNNTFINDKKNVKFVKNV